MRNYKRLTFVLLLVFSFFLIGCQGSNGDSGTQVENNTTSTLTVTLPISSATVTLNSEAVNIEIRVYDSQNTPYSSGNIKIIFPDDVKTGRDIGSFDAISVPVSNGVANFSYTAPNDLKSDTSDIRFQFYHDEEPTLIKTFTVAIAPAVDQIILNSYSLTSNIGTDVSMGLNSAKLVSFTVQNDKNESVEDSKMSSVTITLMNPSLGTLEDTVGHSGSSITVNDKNSVSVNIKSNTKSGIVPIKVEAVFSDVNSQTQTISEVFNVVVLSGPPSAMSLSYAGTEQIKDRAKFVESWVLTVTDKYNNLVNTNPAVSMGMIAGYAQDSSNASGNSANYLFYSPGATGGTLSADSDSFTTTGGVFDDVDLQNDILVTFGDGYTYNASGKWDISTISSTELGLQDDYAGTDTVNLGFAVGHNQRDEVCSDSGSSAVANVYPLDNNYIIDSTGSMTVQIEYDYYLTGKSTVLWVNLVGKDYATNETVKIGEAKKITLRAKGLTSEVKTYSKGDTVSITGSIKVHMFITGTTEWYKNANFVNGGIEAGDISLTSSNSNNSATSCLEDGTGRAYVEVNITSPAAKAGTITITNLTVSNEF